jgi:hypothetical protein
MNKLQKAIVFNQYGLEGIMQNNIFSLYLLTFTYPLEKKIVIE